METGYIRAGAGWYSLRQSLYSFVVIPIFRKWEVATLR